jgi:hypothetical protein
VYREQLKRTELVFLFFSLSSSCSAQISRIVTFACYTRPFLVLLRTLRATPPRAGCRFGLILLLVLLLTPLLPFRCLFAFIQGWKGKSPKLNMMIARASFEKQRESGFKRNQAKITCAGAGSEPRGRVRCPCVLAV